MYEQDPLPGLELPSDDHRPRHDRDGDHWTWRQPGFWCASTCMCNGAWRIDEVEVRYGPLTICDCPDPVIEAENGATD